MVKFVIRPATADDCSDILRLIKVAGGPGPSWGEVGGGGKGRWLCFRPSPHPGLVPLPARFPQPCSGPGSGN